MLINIFAQRLTLNLSAEDRSLLGKLITKHFEQHGFGERELLAVTLTASSIDLDPGQVRSFAKDFFSALDVPNVLFVACHDSAEHVHAIVAKQDTSDWATVWTRMTGANIDRGVDVQNVEALDGWATYCMQPRFRHHMRIEDRVCALGEFAEVWTRAYEEFSGVVSARVPWSRRLNCKACGAVIPISRKPTAEHCSDRCSNRARQTRYRVKARPAAPVMRAIARALGFTESEPTLIEVVEHAVLPKSSHDAAESATRDLDASRLRLAPADRGVVQQRNVMDAHRHARLVRLG